MPGASWQNSRKSRRLGSHSSSNPRCVVTPKSRSNKPVRSENTAIEMKPDINAHGKYCRGENSDQDTGSKWLTSRQRNALVMHSTAPALSKSFRFLMSDTANMAANPESKETTTKPMGVASISPDCAASRATINIATLLLINVAISMATAAMQLMHTKPNCIGVKRTPNKASPSLRLSTLKTTRTLRRSSSLIDR